MNAKLELVRNWLIKAQQHDLAAARKLSTGPDLYLDVAIYHCQQSAEKAIKGFLVFYDQPFEKTHDLDVLVTQAINCDTSFSEWRDEAVLLTPYATEYRYPGGVLAPDPAEFDQALQSATGIYSFVISLLPPEAQP